MNKEKAIEILANTAWLGTNKDRELVEGAIRFLANEEATVPVASTPVVNTDKQDKYWLLANAIKYHNAGETDPDEYVMADRFWNAADLYCKLGDPAYDLIVDAVRAKLFKKQERNNPF